MIPNGFAAGPGLLLVYGVSPSFHVSAQEQANMCRMHAWVRMSPGTVSSCLGFQPRKRRIPAASAVYLWPGIEWKKIAFNRDIRRHSLKVKHCEMPKKWKRPLRWPNPIHSSFVSYYLRASRLVAPSGADKLNCWKPGREAATTMDLASSRSATLKTSRQLHLAIELYFLSKSCLIRSTYVN